MRKFTIVILTLIVAVAVALAAVVIYLSTAVPAASGGVHFPLTPAQLDLLAAVPANAETFALIPAASAVRARLIANPLTRDPILEWIDKPQVPRPWMIGDADLVMWRAAKRTSYAIHLDPLRAGIVRVYLMLGSGLDARVSAGTLLINPAAGEPLGASRLDRILAVANGLPSADAVVVQQGPESNGFPPMPRPVVTTVQIGAEDLNLTSLSARVESPDRGPQTSEPQPAVRPRFPEGALLAATFRHPPRFVSDLDRLLMSKVSRLLDDGGTIVLYDVNAGTLMPRPDGLIVANATEQNEEVISRIEPAVRLFGEIRRKGSELLVSFDNESMGRYSAEAFANASWLSNDWSVRLDPQRAAPILKRLGDNTGLRLIAPRLYRSARDLRRWIDWLSSARSLEAAHSVNAATEELRVRVAK